ncbi:mechanosensitive ion channel family protein [Gelidibacter japonicus]|uniref:mechanosensitive ion channel family protein n=1 Tax=Gelidibacter japonicus TaxID=1962232 RepID=UPI0013D0DEC1|nr:mechanosensitive ion channel family protein [Gelidibacter japonicus]MCL8007312.1 mechanosensitive ion channel family protein [Gelidibacter japonicus]
MTKFLETHQSDIIYAASVVAIVVLLYLLTRALRKWFTKKIQEKLPGASVRPIHLIQRILTLLWFLLGITALSFIIIDDEREAIITEYFKLFSYVGVVAVLTIISLMISNLWFKYKISQKIEGNEDPTNYKFFRYVALFVIGIMGALIASLAFPSLKGVAQTTLGGAGIMALIVGFAAQEGLSNITGGLFIIAFKPFRVGDRIKVSDTMVGTVTDVTLRHTIIKNFENKMIVIPNAIINKEKLINYDFEEHILCEHIELGISYDSDIDLAKKIIREECENHPLILDTRSVTDLEEGKPLVRTALTTLNDFSITIRAWAWVRNHSDSFSLKCDVLESIKKRFDKEGVEIPYPYRTIVMKDFNEKSIEGSE